MKWRRAGCEWGGFSSTVRSPPQFLTTPNRIPLNRRYFWKKVNLCGSGDRPAKYPSSYVSCVRSSTVVRRRPLSTPVPSPITDGRSLCPITFPPHPIRLSICPHFQPAIALTVRENAPFEKGKRKIVDQTRGEAFSVAVARRRKHPSLKRGGLSLDLTDRSTLTERRSVEAEAQSVKKRRGGCWVGIGMDLAGLV